MDCEGSIATAMSLWAQIEAAARADPRFEAAETTFPNENGP